MISGTQLDIKKIAEMDLPNACLKQSTRGSFNLTCPFCGGKYKLNINPEKHVWRCAKCDESGNAVSLHAKIKNMSYEEAAKDLEEIVIHGKYQLAASTTESPKWLYPADILKRNSVYQNLLSKLNLKKEHVLGLRKRGLKVSDMYMLEYRSYPQDNLRELATEVIGQSKVQFSQYEGIPGFYSIHENPDLVKKRDGILIPVRDHNDKISGFQIRASYVYGDIPRYTWFSSGDREDGCSVSGIENIHHAGNWRRVRLPETIYLTEGALKADVAAVLADRLRPNREHLFLGLTGVNNVSQLAKELEYCGKYGVKEVAVCVDMDYRQKKEVANALRKIEAIISNVYYPTDTYINSENADAYKGKRTSDGRIMKHMRYKTLTWNERYKGIDDYLYSRMPESYSSVAAH